MLYVYVVGFLLGLRKTEAIESFGALEDLLFLVDDAGCRRYMGPLRDIEAVMKCKAVGTHDLSVKDKSTEALHSGDLTDETVDLVHFADAFFGPSVFSHSGVDLFSKGSDVFRRCGQFKKYLRQEERGRHKASKVDAEEAHGDVGWVALVWLGFFQKPGNHIFRFHFPSFSVLLKHGDAIPQQVADYFGGFPFVPRKRGEIRSHKWSEEV